MSWDKSAKRIIRILGLLLSLLCCFYVGRELLSDKSPVRGGFQVKVLWPLAASTGCWILANTALGLGWGSIIRMLGSEIEYKATVQLSFRTQVAKYLPGNVFHLLGRVVLAKQYGVSASVAGLATVMESFGLVVIAGLLGASFLVRQGYGVLALCILAVGVMIAGIFLESSSVRTKLGLAQRPRLGNSSAIVVGGLSYISIFLLQAAMFLFFAVTLSEPARLGFLQVLEMVSVTWAAGFVVVGAPGGLGVREAAYSLFATSTEIKMNFLFVASWMRVSSILGDLICFGLSRYILKSPEESTANGEPR